MSTAFRGGYFGRAWEQEWYIPTRASRRDNRD